MKRMLAFLYSVIIFSIVVSVFFLSRSYHPYSPHETSVHFPALLISCWLFAAAMFGGVFYTYRLAGFFDLTIERAIFIILIVTLIAGAFSRSPSLHPRRAIELAFILFAFICLASMAVHGFGPSSPRLTSPWYIFITAYLFPFLAFLFAKRYLVTERDFSILFHTLFYLGAYLAIIAFFEFFDLRQYVYPRFIVDPKVLAHWDRARGPFYNSALNGFAMVIGFICGVQILSSKRGFAKVLHLILMSLFFPAVFFTLTRSVYLCFLFTLGTLLFAYRTPLSKWKLLALPLALALIFGSMNLHRLESSNRREGGVYQVEEVHIREALFNMSMIMIADNPVLGVGFAQFLPASLTRYRALVPLAQQFEPTSEHHQILTIAVEVGLIGVTLYLWMIVMFLIRAYSLFTWFPSTGYFDPNLALLIGLALGVYILNSLFIDPSYQLFPNAVFFTFGGIADGLYGRLPQIQAAAEVAIPLGLSPSYGA